MKAYFARLGKYLLLLFTLFTLERTAFLATYHVQVGQSPWGEILSTYLHALHLDLSALAYCFLIPFILITLELCFSSKWIERILHGYTILLLIFIVLSALGNLFLYDEWSTKLNYRIWYYLKKPSEVIRTATGFQLVGGGIIAILLFFGTIWLYFKWFAKPIIKSIKKFYWQTALLEVVGFFLIFVGMRGKLTGIPISQSNAYFSKNQVLNDAATNTQWHLLKSTLRFARTNSENPYVSMSDEKAKRVVKELFSCERDTCIHVLKEKKPNIVLIFMESWSADLVESLGGRAGITPGFRELEKEGILFTQVYAAGRRSQEGISAMLSGFPPIPVNVVTDNFEKYHGLPSITKVLNDNGYTSSFYFGGDLTYGNLRAYLMSMQYQRIIDEDDFPSGTPHGKLSIHDEYTLARQLAELHTEKQPFFSTLFTASSHSPYDVPTTAGTLDWDVPQLGYLNSAKYSDYALVQYFAKAKKEGWYDHTLFILVADHSHETYKQWDYHDAGYQHIPMLWIGGALKEEWRGKQIDKLCSYIDLPLTLLHQLDLDASDFRWSNDIFNPYTHQFAPFLNQLGIGWITPDGSFSYHHGREGYYRCTIEDYTQMEREKVNAKAYLQLLYQTYLDL
jgi:phosphoglycerol transferase MdoB-like AlkP superfamily enzyme